MTGHAPDRLEMRILSLNTWGGRVGDPLITWLGQADADVFCLQEMIHTPAASSAWLTYRDDGIVLPQRANLFGEVSAALPAHRAFFCAAARGPLYEGERVLQSEWGLATFVRRTFPIIAQAQDFVHGTFAADGFGPHPRSRNAHAVRLFDDGTGAPVTIAHMHGLRELTGKTDTPARHAQAKAFVELILRIARKGERLVVCGDFNVLPDSVTLEALQAIGLTDLVTGGGHTDTRTSLYTKSGRYANYMLVNEAVKVRRFEVVREPEVSDHRALLLEIA